MKKNICEIFFFFYKGRAWSCQKCPNEIARGIIFNINKNKENFFLYIPPIFILKLKKI